MSDGIRNPFEGLDAQLRRAERFRDSVDPVAAVAAYRTFTDFVRPRLPGLRVAAGLPAEPGTRRDGKTIAARDGARVDPADLRLYTLKSGTPDRHRRPSCRRAWAG